MIEHPRNVDAARPSASEDGLFDFRRTRSFTTEYVATFYGDHPPTEDERAVLAFLTTHAGRIAGRPRMLEVGCGPTIHHVFPFVPYVSAVDMADYLPENLAAVRRWQTRAPGAYSWRQYARLAVELQSREATDEEVDRLEADARARIGRLLPCDLKQPAILARAGHLSGGRRVLLHRRSRHLHPAMGVRDGAPGTHREPGRHAVPLLPAGHRLLPGRRDALPVRPHHGRRRAPRPAEPRLRHGRIGDRERHVGITTRQQGCSESSWPPRASAPELFSWRPTSSSACASRDRGANDIRRRPVAMPSIGPVNMRLAV